METKNKYYQLMNDLDFTGVDYPKIDFKGNFNGNNKTFRNISTVGTGVFNNVGDYNATAVVENLNIENIKVSPETGNHLGGLAASIENATVKNVHLKSGSVKNVKSTYNILASTGGFAGSVYNDVSIENCSSSLEVSSESNVGGLIGINQNATIKNSYANGIVNGKVNVGGFIGIQCITDTQYKVPENVYFDEAKAKTTKAVGGYASSLHNLQVLSENDLGKGIVGILVPEEINLNKLEAVDYNIITRPNTNLTFTITSSDTKIVKYENHKIQGVKNGMANIYVELKVGTQVMRMESKVNVSMPVPTPTPTTTPTPTIKPTPTPTTTPTPTIKPLEEAEVLKGFALTKQDGYIVGFQLGNSVADIKKQLSSEPNVKLSRFTDASGKEISTGTISTNMKFTLIFNQKEYHYTVVVKGDVNGDGAIYATDYVKIKNHIMGKAKLEGAYLKAADINNDNNIYATDYVRIKNYIMGKGNIEQNF